MLAGRGACTRWSVQGLCPAWCCPGPPAVLWQSRHNEWWSRVLPRSFSRQHAAAALPEAAAGPVRVPLAHIPKGCSPVTACTEGDLHVPEHLNLLGWAGEAHRKQPPITKMTCPGTRTAGWAWGCSNASHTTQPTGHSCTAAKAAAWTTPGTSGPPAAAQPPPAAAQSQGGLLAGAGLPGQAAHRASAHGLEAGQPFARSAAGTGRISPVQSHMQPLMTSGQRSSAQSAASTASSLTVPSATPGIHLLNGLSLRTQTSTQPGARPAWCCQGREPLHSDAALQLIATVCDTGPCRACTMVVYIIMTTPSLTHLMRI